MSDELWGLVSSSTEQTFVQEFAQVPHWKGWGGDAVSAGGGRATGNSSEVYDSRGAALGEPPAAETPPDPTSSRCRCLQTNGTRGCPNCRRLSVKPGYV